MHYHFCLFFFSEPFDISCICDAFYPSRLQCVFSKNKDILIHNHCTVIKMRKWTLIQYYYLITDHIPVLTNRIISVLCIIVKGEKMVFLTDSGSSPGHRLQVLQVLVACTPKELNDFMCYMGLPDMNRLGLHNFCWV